MYTPVSAVRPTSTDTRSLRFPKKSIEDAALLGMPVWIKRDDLLHPIISGNKFRKLKFPLQHIQEKYQITGRRPCLITMGGIWSNHLHAVAYAAAEHGYASIGLVRGHAGTQSATLDDCRAQGMQVQCVNRETYRVLRNDPQYWRSLCDVQNVEPYWLPEGGSDPAALHGVAELIDELEFTPDVILVACGTAATLAGLLAGLKDRSRVIGIAVIKNSYYLHAEIARLLQQADYPAYKNYQLLTDFHHGGYAKLSPALLQFCTEFIEQTHIPIEPIYTGKVFYALRELIKSNYFQPQEKVLVVHTGGMQGVRGINLTQPNKPVPSAILPHSCYTPAPPVRRVQIDSL